MSNNLLSALFNRRSSPVALRAADQPPPVKLVDHLIATDPLPPMRAAMFEYVVAGNGLFVRGRRAGVSVMLPTTYATIKGLPEVEPFFTLEYPLVPSHFVEEMLQVALAQKRGTTFLECLFHLWWEGEWRMVFPPQHQTELSVRPLHSGPSSSYAKALIESHSHHRMAPSPSLTDDFDEVGFRIFGVLGRITTEPVLQVRVGLYGHRWTIPASWVFEMPAVVGETL